MRSPSSVAQRGVSLIELMVTVSLAAIMGVLAIPRIPEMQHSYDRINTQAYLTQDIKRAQAQSITEGCRGILTIAADQKSYSFGCDYLPYDTANPPLPDTISFVRKLPKDIGISSNQPIIFNSRGQSVDIYYVISTTNIALRNIISGAVFTNGTLLGTGVLSYD